MIYFLLPIYNEAQNIPELIEEIRKLALGQKCKIVAVNDGSNDNSLALLNELRDHDLIIESTPLNMNVGAVFSAGLSKIASDSKDENDTVIIIEADQTSSLDTVNDLLYEMHEKNKDIVIASRYQKGGGYTRFPLTRKMFSQNANSLLRKCFPIEGVLDYTIFFRAYRIGIIQEAMKCFGAFGLIQSKGFAANAELLIKLSLFTNKISEVPFIYDYGKKKGKSKIKVLGTINETFVLIGYLKEIARKFRKSGRT
ncbi:glycosyltransferase [Candidatus Omnitrophota bacterium]